MGKWARIRLVLKFGAAGTGAVAAALLVANPLGLAGLVIAGVAAGLGALGTDLPRDKWKRADRAPGGLSSEDKTPPPATQPPPTPKP